jgi:hypothetical protein
MTEFHEICEEEKSAPKPMAHFGSVGTIEKHLEDIAHGAIAQKQNLHQYQTVVKARNRLKQSL